MAERLLDVKDLKVRFATEDGIVHAVDGVNFTLDRGEVLGDRRRVRLRQERDRDDDPRAHARTEHALRGRDRSTRART